MTRRISILIPGANRVDVERMSAFERRFLTLARNLGFIVLGFQVHEDRHGAELPAVEIEVQQGPPRSGETEESHQDDSSLLAAMQKGEKNVFWAVEEIHDHLAAVWWALGQMGREVGTMENRPFFPAGTPEHHVQAAAKLLDQLELMLALLLPRMFQASDRDSEHDIPIRHEAHDIGAATGSTERLGKAE